MQIFPPDINVDFMRYRKLWLAVAGLLLVVAIAALAIRGLAFGLDFTGGSVAELRFAQPVEADAVRERLEQAGYDDAVVQTLGSRTELVVRLQPREGQGVEQTGSAIRAAVNTPENPVTLTRSDFVGPQVGKELAENGVLAVLFVLVGFLVYITARFEWKFAVAASSITIVDVIVTTGWFAISQHEFDLTVLAGVLSVMGFSINDKIVVFDRVREMFRGTRRMESAEVLNRAINQTLSRTVITSVVAFLTVLALYLFGGATLQGMAESIMIGIVLGTLSSILVACPVLLLLGVTKQDLMPKARDDAELARRP